MDFKRPLRWMRAQLFEWTGSHRSARQLLDGSRAAVLMYHRVLPGSLAARDAVEPGMYVTPETFALHLDCLEADFRVLPLHEVVERLASGDSIPPGACAITFDDGWRDNHEHALPELARRGVPATVFVVTDRVGTSGAFWPDEVCRRMASIPRADQGRLARELGAMASGAPVDAVLALFKRLPETERPHHLERIRAATRDLPPARRELLDWDELDALARAGTDVESHGATHAILTESSDQQVLEELRSARVSLRERGHGRHDLLAYPSGAFDDNVVRIAREVGYRAGVTIERGLMDAKTEPMALPRLGLHEDVSRSRAEFLSRVPGRATMSEIASRARRESSMRPSQGTGPEASGLTGAKEHPGS